MTGSFARGLAAGAAGTTVLNTITYLDMAVRGRPASSTPEQTIDALADAAGTSVPGKGAERDARRSALGSLAGIANGVGVGVLASLARAAGIHPPGPLDAMTIAAVSMALTDGTTTVLGISDPRTWSAADWASDAIPHLAYGAAVQAVIDAVPTSTDHPRQPAGAGLTFRSALLGVAAGCRSSLGLAAPALTSADGGFLRKAGALAAVGGEVYADKQPSTPDRTGGQGLGVRLASAASGAVALSARQDMNAAAPIVAAVAGAVAGSFGGLGWRRWANAALPDWQAGVLEDVIAVTLALAAALPGRRPDRRRVLEVSV